MVGYLQAMDVDQALAEVNASANAKGIAPLTIRRGSADAPTELDHQLDRPFPDSPFLLMHLWARGQAGRRTGDSHGRKPSTSAMNEPA